MNDKKTHYFSLITKTMLDGSGIYIYIDILFYIGFKLLNFPWRNNMIVPVANGI